MKNNLAVHMRYHLFSHYGWFLQNLGKDFIPSIMHTPVREKEMNIGRKQAFYRYFISVVKRCRKKKKKK